VTVQPNTRAQLMCARCGLAFCLLAVFPFVAAGIIPPISESWTAAQVVHHYAAHRDLIRAGLVVGMFLVGLMLPFFGVITTQMPRIEGRNPVLAITQLCAGAASFVFLMIPMVVLLVAALRPDRSPSTTLALNDLGWTLLVIPATSFSVQSLCIGFAVLGDRSERPVFPRWLAHVCFCDAVMLVPAALSCFFTTGPFAWQGLISFYVAAVAVFGSYLALYIALTRAIRQEAPDGTQVALDGARVAA